MKRILFTMMMVIGIIGSSGGLYAEERVLPVQSLPGSAGAVALCGDGKFLYLAGSGKFQVWKITDHPENPRRIAELTGLPGWECRQIIVHRGYAYITARNRGLWIVDVRNPERPRKVGSFDTAELATGVDALGDVLFVTLRVFGVQTFDISNPENPRHLTLYRTFEAQSAYCSGTVLALGEWGNSSVLLLDVSDPGKPVELAKIQLDGFGDGVFIQNGILYAATGHHARKGTWKERHGAGHGVELFDISDPRNPKKIGAVKFPKFYSIGNDFWSPRPAGEWLAVADTHNGMFLVDCRDPKAPKVAASLKLPMVRQGKKEIPDCVGAVVPGRDVIYVAGAKSGLHVVRVPGSRPLPERKEGLAVRSHPQAPDVPGFVRYDCGGMVRRVAVSGEFLYAAASAAGLKIFRAQSGNLKEVGAVTGNRIYDVAVAGDLLVTVGDGFALTTYRVLKDGTLRKLGEFRSAWLPMQIVHLYENGSVAAVSGGTGRVNFFDLRNPEKPVLKNFYPEKRILYCDAFPERPLDGKIPVNTHGAGLSWYRLTGDGAVREKEVASVRFHQMDGITALKEKFLIPSAKKGYYLISPEDYGVSGLKREFRADAPVSGNPVWDGGSKIVFSHSRDGQVTVFDAADPERLKILRKIDFLPGTPDRIAFWNGKMVVPAGFSGLYLER